MNLPPSSWNLPPTSLPEEPPSSVAAKPILPESTPQLEQTEAISAVSQPVALQFAHSVPYSSAPVYPRIPEPSRVSPPTTDYESLGAAKVEKASSENITGVGDRPSLESFQEDTSSLQPGVGERLGKKVDKVLAGAKQGLAEKTEVVKDAAKQAGAKVKQMLPKDDPEFKETFAETTEAAKDVFNEAAHKIREVLPSAPTEASVTSTVQHAVEVVKETACNGKAFVQELME